MAQIQADGSKKQSKGNGQGHNECAAKITQKDEKNDHDQDHAFGKVVQDGVRSVVDQCIPVQVRNDLYSRRENVIVEPLDHGAQALQHGFGVRALAQEDNALDHVVIILNHAVSAVDGFADLAETNFRTLRNHSNVPDP